MGRDLNRLFFREDTEMANRHTKKTLPTLLILKGCKPNYRERPPHTVRMAVVRKSTDKLGEGVRREPPAPLVV